MGGAQVAVLAAAFVRNKVIALTLGASGVGLIGLLGAFSGNISALAGWGLGTSGVRLIAGANDWEKEGKVAAVRRMGWMLSLIGMGLGCLLFWPTAWLTFASTEYEVEMAIVVFAVPCLIASTAWSAILQASGKIRALAKVQISAAFAGLVLGLPAIWFWGTLGVAFSIFLAAAIPALLLWRTAHSESTSVSVAKADKADIRKLVTLGGALMAVAWLGQFSAYLVRLFIVRQEGLEAAGYYQAAYAISGSLPSLVFAAMGADFFPRVAAARDEEEGVLITENQIVAGLLLGVPLIVALLTLDRLFLSLLFADSFKPAAPLLSWMAWGVFIRLIAWPLGYWMMARQSAASLVVVEVAGCLLSLVIPVALMEMYGLVGAGIGFTASAIMYAVMLAWLMLRRSTFAQGARMAKAILLATLVVGSCQWIASLSQNIFFGFFPTVITSIYSVWGYRRIMVREQRGQDS